MRAFLFGTAAALMLAGAAVAQSNPQTTTSPAPCTATPPAATSATPAPADTMNHTGMNDKDANGAVNTSGNQDMMPAHGANSFTRGEARARIAKHGYTNVKLMRKKDANGVWRGTAMHDGQSVSVWLDYKGDVGQQ